MINRHSKNILRWMLVTLLASVPVAVAANSNKVIYSETFKKGATRITEQTLDVALTPTMPGRSSKSLTQTASPLHLHFVPDIPTGDTKVVDGLSGSRCASQNLRQHPSTSPDVSQDTQQLWWLDAKPYAKTLLQAQRVFKVEQFYCVLAGKDVKRLATVTAVLHLNQIRRDVTPLSTMHFTWKHAIELLDLEYPLGCNKVLA